MERKKAVLKIYPTSNNPILSGDKTTADWKKSMTDGKIMSLTPPETNKTKNHSSVRKSNTTQEERERKRTGKRFQRTIEHAMSYTFGYAYTLTAPANHACRSDSKLFLQKIKEFVQMYCADTEVFIELQNYSKFSSHSNEFHAHGMSDKPFPIEAWAEFIDANEDDLYMEKIQNQLAWAKYITRDISRFPARKHSYYTTVPKKQAYTYFMAEDGHITTNDPDPYTHLSPLLYAEEDDSTNEFWDYEPEDDDDDICWIDDYTGIDSDTGIFIYASRRKTSNVSIVPSLLPEALPFLSVPAANTSPHSDFKSLHMADFQAELPFSNVQDNRDNSMDIYPALPKPAVFSDTIEWLNDYLGIDRFSGIPVWISQENGELHYLELPSPGYKVFK